MLRSVTSEVQGTPDCARLDPETGVYFRLRGSDFLVGSSAKERPMGSKRPARREFLKSGAALAGGFTLGAVAPAIGQTPALPADDQGRQGSDRLRRSLQACHLGPHPTRRPAVARQLRADLSCGVAASGFRGRDHPILTPLLRDDPWILPPGHRSPRAQSDDPRPGGPSADLHHGGLEAPPFRHPPAFHRVRGEPGVAQGTRRFRKRTA